MNDRKDMHVGHRQRIKRKARRVGIKNFEEHEILELLLTYCIPRKDTNPIAHNLINRFGSLNGVVEADFKQLKLVEGVGEESALFIGVLKDFIEYYLENSNTETEGNIDSSAKVISYFRRHYVIKNNEHILGLCLNKNLKIVNRFVVEGDDATEVNMTIEFLAQYISANNVEHLVLCHTHPRGEVNPSEDDIRVTNRISLVCSAFGVTLDDHIILNENSQFSFRTAGLMKESSKNVAVEPFKKGENLLKPKS